MLLKTIAFVLLLLGLAMPNVAPAQGTTYFSNLSLPSGGSLVIGSDAWVAVPFYVGSNFDGYLLNSVQLLMGQASGSPGGFKASIFKSDGGRMPGTSLGNLSGDDPALGGIFSYTGSEITLPSQVPYFYFVVVTASMPTAQGSYSWNYATSADYSSSGGWHGGTFVYTSTDGSSWSPHTFYENPFQFAINATANIPEPSPFSLLGLGASFLAASLIRRRRSN